jgi:hypothetical protein
MPTASGTASSDAGHRKSIRPEEYVGYLHNRPVATEPIVRYDLDVGQPGHHPGQAIPVLVNSATSEQEVPPESFVLPAASSADPFAETDTLTYTEGASIQQVVAGSRPSSVTQWISTFVDPYGIGPVNWFNSDGWVGFGIGMHTNDRTLEDRSRVHFNFQNPTFGGATSLQGDPVDLEDAVLAPVSPQLHFAYAEGSNGYVEGAVIPFEFNDYGQGNPGTGNTPHGDTSTRNSLFWRHKQFQRVDFHYGGREFIHRIVAWSYLPYALDNSDFGGSVLPPLAEGEELALGTQVIHSGLGVSAIGMDEAYVWDVAVGGQLQAVPDWNTATTGTGTTYIAESTNWRGEGENPFGPLSTPYPSGYGAVIFRRTSDDFCLAMAARLGPISTDIINVGRIRRDFDINRLQFNDRVSGGTRDPLIPPQGQSWRYSMVQIAGSVVGRDQGWAGANTWYFVGPYSLVQTTLLELRTSGLLDSAADPSIVPASVREGTELADPPTGGIGTGGIGDQVLSSRPVGPSAFARKTAPSSHRQGIRPPTT